MTFTPVNEHHAIVNVAFILHVSPNINEEEKKSVKESHSSWHDLLPRIDEFTPIGDIVPRGIDQQQLPTPPVSFSRYKPDGNVELRLMVDHENLIFECWQYSSWELVWKRSHEVFKKMSGALNDESRQIKACALHYTDEFAYDGNEEIDFRELLEPSSDSIPGRIFKCGNVWHLNQGWFSDGDQSLQGRILERIDVSSRQISGKYVVQFENLNRFEFKNSKLPLYTAFDSGFETTEKIFSSLHQANKDLMKEFLNQKMLEKIALN